jgi:hypothetical protein
MSVKENPIVSMTEMPAKVVRRKSPDEMLRMKYDFQAFLHKKMKIKKFAAGRPR